MARESRHKRKRATRHDDREDAGERDLSASFLPANNNMRVTRSKAKHQNTSLVGIRSPSLFLNQEEIHFAMFSSTADMFIASPLSSFVGKSM